MLKLPIFIIIFQWHPVVEVRPVPGTLLRPPCRLLTGERSSNLQISETEMKHFKCDRAGNWPTSHQFLLLGVPCLPNTSPASAILLMILRYCMFSPGSLMCIQKEIRDNLLICCPIAVGCNGGDIGQQDQTAVPKAGNRRFLNIMWLLKERMRLLILLLILKIL